MIGITRLLCGQSMPGDDLRYEGSTVHKKPVVVWNLTRRCNLHCIHCYIDAWERESAEELTTEEGKRLIDDLAKFGVSSLLLSGGEPLLRDDLFALIEHAVGKGIRVTLSTNGILLTPRIARGLKEVGVSYVGISIDGAQETHDRFRGREGAFEESLRGIRNCRDTGMKVGLRFTIAKYNHHQLSYVFDLLEEEDLPRCCFYHLVYTGRGRRLINGDLNHEETRKAVGLIFERTLDLHRRGRVKEILTVAGHSDGVYLYLKLKEENPVRAEEVHKLLLLNGGNSSGVGIACIDSVGEVHADQFWHHYSFGNVRRRNFSEIWEDPSDPLMWGLRNKRYMIKGRCARCRYFEICAGNMRVRAEAFYGDVWAEDPACYLRDEEIGIDAST